MNRLTIASAALLAVASAHAQTVIYTDLSPSTYLSATPWIFSKTMGPPTRSTTQGFEFETTGTGTLSTIDAAIANISGSTSITAQVFTNLSDMPDTLLATTTATAAANPGGLAAFNFASGPSLAKSTDYWLVLSTSDAGVDDWFRNGNGITGERIQNGALMPVATTAAFDVKVAVVTPEPASFAALGLSVVGLLRLRPRRRS